MARYCRGEPLQDWKVRAWYRSVLAIIANRPLAFPQEQEVLGMNQQRLLDEILPQVTKPVATQGRMECCPQGLERYTGEIRPGLPRYL